MSGIYRDRKYRFDSSQGLTIGCIYTLATVIILLPVGYVAEKLESCIGAGELSVSTALVTLGIAAAIWALLICSLARFLTERMIESRKQEQFNRIQEFQTATASLFHEEELYRKIVETIQGSIKNVGVIIFLKKEGTEEFEPVYRDAMGTEVDKEEYEKLLERLHASQAGEHNDLILLQYDGQIQGFIYLKFPSQFRLSYIEANCCRQIGMYASVCLKNIDVYQRVYQISTHDDLTGLYNRTYCMEYLKTHWNKDKPLTAIRMDVDDFKLFNELYGQSSGDEILKWCSEMIRSTVGEYPVFRMDSNEYMVLVDSGDREQVLELAERIRMKIVKADEDRPKVLQPITLSIGISMYPGMAADEEQLLRQAERATYFAKKNGKNRVEIYEVNENKETEVQEGHKSYEQIPPIIYALMAAIDAKDSYTFEHSCHVSEYAVLVAKKIGLKQEEVQIIKEAGLLHDIGKIGIPESILTKAARLTEEEYEIMKTHVTNSIEMIHFLPNMSYVIPAVVSHHERYDGKGYPRGIKGKEIPLMGRILAICDSFDAMTTARCYRDAMPLSYAEGELERCKGKQFDPALTDVFIQLIREGKIVVQEK